MGFVDIASNVFCLFAIPIIGKRLIMMIGLTGVVVFCFSVAVNAYFYLDFATSSFVWQSLPGGRTDDNPYALPIFICLGISASISGCVPWMMISEVYPFRYCLLKTINLHF